MIFDVTVTTVAGVSCTVNLDQDSTILDLKKELANRLGIPAPCQALLSNGACEALPDVVFVTSEQHYQLVISLETVRESLESGIRQRQMAALETLTEMGSNSGSRGADAEASLVASVIEALTSIDVCCKAIEFLCAFAEKGDEQAVNSLLLCIKHPDSTTRLEALRALSKIADKGNQHVIAEMKALLKQENEDFVWHTALAVLAELETEGDGCLMAAALNRLESCIAGFDTDLVDIQAAAITTLAHTAQRGNRRVISALTAMLGHELWQLRLAAVEALGEVAEIGNQHSFAAVSELLSDDNSCLRQLVAEVLPKMATKNDQFAIATVLAQLEKKGSGVHMTVAAVLEQLVDKHNMSVIDAIMSYVEHVDSRVRQSAIHVLSHVIDKGTEQAVSGLVARLGHSSADVRAAVLGALRLMAKRRDQNVIMAVTSMVNDSDLAVQCAAASALTDLA
eukprot:TRINITY_DN48541_c0_g1_i1.p1 TRINITY_DN48541_c0_g1~~TRINITY_DN48541_c0_g1_i1.p1  ORF type:complete len:452 (-),score=74.02 TRINITY_DN48541_c0_g1_i1:38-1393(-)